MPKDTKELVVVEVSELACCLMLPKVLGAQLFFCVVPLVNLCNYMKLCVVGCVCGGSVCIQLVWDLFSSLC